MTYNLWSIYYICCYVSEQLQTGFGLITGFINLLQLVNTINSSVITPSHSAIHCSTRLIFSVYSTVSSPVLWSRLQTADVTLPLGSWTVLVSQPKQLLANSHTTTTYSKRLFLHKLNSCLTIFSLITSRHGQPENNVHCSSIVVRLHINGYCLQSYYPAVAGRIVACLVVLVVILFQCDLPYNSLSVPIIIKIASVIKQQ
jgi:hypothetical protein